MKMMFKSFTKKLFGVRYERLGKNNIVYLIVFWGLHISGFQIQIAPFILYLMTSSFTAGVMWQTLSSEDNATNMMNLFMLPFGGRDFIFSYVSALGAYTLLTKTGALLVVVAAVSSWNILEIAGSILCAVNAVIMTACVYSQKSRWGIGMLWAGIIIATIFLIWNTSVFLPLVAGNCLLAFVILRGADAYSFYQTTNGSNHVTKGLDHHSIFRYLFRYLIAHKNYLINTMIMWGVACVLPVMFGHMESQFMLLVGFAILSLNTPICILLSCDSALEQAVRFLPRQKEGFCIPYCVCIFLCNLTVDIVFLCSWEIQIGGITFPVILPAVFFALQSAVGSVLMEWLYPIRGWKIESDLWHHPRKYVVPVFLLLIASIVGTASWLIYALLALLAIECVILLLRCRRG